MSQGLREEEEEALEEVIAEEDIVEETIIGEEEEIAMIGNNREVEVVEMVSNLMIGMAAGEEVKEAMIAIEASIVEVAIAIGLKSTLTSSQTQMTQISTRSMPLRRERRKTHSLTAKEVEAEVAIEEEEEAEEVEEITNRIVSRKMRRLSASLALKTSPSTTNREVAEEEETTNSATTTSKAVEEAVVAEVATSAKRINSSPLVRTQWLRMATRTSLT